ncbi:hypothetical protein M9H77_24694 [Catharanthus roseus]|uniref:Uncharacterized protein n=1 Tax=Catharanthus roseus TaxID=4058 RepID=A0ACC0A551_CATRO|nr:hypothetical protein M9H77_24694 [Catharanthus roseus]
MSKITRRCSLRFSLFFLISSLFQWISGLADSSPSLKSEDGSKNASNGSSKKAIGLTVVLICLGILATVAFSVLLFKIWQKKRREAQQARLLKLFEDDDELEVELGIRD